MEGGDKGPSGVQFWADEVRCLCEEGMANTRISENFESSFTLRVRVKVSSGLSEILGYCIHGIQCSVMNIEY